MRKIIAVFLLALLSGNILAIERNEFWNQKDYRQWNQNECEKLLRDSPWAKEVGLSHLGQKYQLRILSALPIRQALVRQMQINDNYESFSTEQRQEYDKRTEEYLALPFNDTVVIHVAGNYLGNYWRVQSTERLRNTTFLITSSNKKIPLLEFKVIAGGSQLIDFLFIFPRHYQGHSILREGKQPLSLEFVYPKSQRDYLRSPALAEMERAFIEFK